MSEKAWDVESRVARVREIASRIIADVGAESTREAMHALSLATGIFIREYYTPSGRTAVIKHHAENVARYAQNDR